MDPKFAARFKPNSAALDTVKSLLQQIMAAATKAGIAILPTVLHQVATIMEADYPNEAGLIAALEAELQTLIPKPPAA
jgi:hypothetical protein